ncbi:hypothetical protein [Pseudonocardia phyllosphaerae]|uniref:hypothetical protein n=1 Tax=Pseudonocardia phyllosphaerae TaxID=3390502 RepID=UPI00397C91BB
MTVDANDPADVTDARRVVTIPELSAPSYLQAVLSVTYRDEHNSVPLTVATPAGLVFGNAVHPATWLHQLGEQLRDLTGDDPQNVAAQSMAAMFDEMAGERGNASREVPADGIHWIYFVNAMIVPSADADPNYTAPACWQVALRDVTGWTIGLPPE